MNDSSKTLIIRQNPIEEESLWINTSTQKLILQEDDIPISPDWTKSKIELSNPLRESIKSMFTIILYFTISAIVAFFVLDHGRAPLNYTMQVWLFPVMSYILIGYRGVDKFLKSIVLGFGALLFIDIPLYYTGLINSSGIIFTYYVGYLILIFIPQYYTQFLNPPVNMILEFSVGLLIGIFVFEFILMILYAIFKRADTIEFALTKKAIFLRSRSKKSRWEDFKQIFYMVFFPLNIQQYLLVRDRIRFNRKKTIEGEKYDYAKIPWNLTSKFKLNTSYSIGKIVSGAILILLGVGFIRVNVMIALILFILALILLITNYRNKKTLYVKFTFDRAKISGSWVLTHTTSTILLKQMAPAVADMFKVHLSMGISDYK